MNNIMKYNWSDETIKWTEDQMQVACVQWLRSNGFGCRSRPERWQEVSQRRCQKEASGHDIR